MMRENLEHIAAMVAASDDPSLPDNECLDLIWAYLQQTCGIDPENYRGQYKVAES
jgi:hypothetical protein